MTNRCRICSCSTDEKSVCEMCNSILIAMVSQDDEIEILQQPNDDDDDEVVNDIHAADTAVESTPDKLTRCLVGGSIAATSSNEMNVEKHVCESCWFDCSPNPNIDASPIGQTNFNVDESTPDDVDTLLVKSFSQVLHEKVQLAKKRGDFIDLSMIQEDVDVYEPYDIEFTSFSNKAVKVIEYCISSEINCSGLFM